MLIEWNDSLTLGDQRIDQEHQDLVMLINRFFQLLKGGAGRDEVCDVAFTLAEHVTQHFNNECALMASFDYPGAAAHQHRHEKLLGEFGAFLHRIGQEDDEELLDVANFLEGWFTTHLLTADAHFVKFLKAQGPGDGHGHSAEAAAAIG